ncbi:MAG: PilN domain-containing protein [Nitrospirae bacterium]|nr:PilN domain-containing protein [Nitrospirota bacterium]
MMIKINLLPYRVIKRKTEVRYVVLVLLVSLMAAGGLMVMLESWVVVRARGLQKEIVLAEAEEARLAKIRVEVDEFKRVEADLQQRLNVLTQLRQSRTGPARFLDDLAASTPERLWVEQFSESEIAPPPPPAPPPGQAEGQAQQAPPPPPPQRIFHVQGKTIDYKSIAEFMINLKNSESFEEVELEEVQEEQQDKGGKYLKFSLRGVIVKVSAEL